jgi:hypothetical protein
MLPEIDDMDDVPELLASAMPSDDASDDTSDPTS